MDRHKMSANANQSYTLLLLLLGRSHSLAVFPRLFPSKANPFSLTVKINKEASP